MQFGKFDQKVPSDQDLHWLFSSHQYHQRVVSLTELWLFWLYQGYLANTLLDKWEDEMCIHAYI